MAEFNSWLAYWEFKINVLDGYRYMLSVKSRRFLNTLLKTSSNRARVLPAGQKFWRACRAHGTEEQRMEGMDPPGLEGYVLDEPIPCRRDRLRPFREKAHEGRVNPKGIPCLYLADDDKTALLEVRPPVGSYVTLAKFATKRELKLVDFSIDTKAPKNLLDGPGTAEEREAVVWFMVNDAFSQPINSGDDYADYAPTQIIAEAFRSKGFDGLVFKSSLGDGKNLALFDMDAVDLVLRELRKIDGIKIADSRIGPRNVEPDYWDEELIDGDPDERYVLPSDV